MGRQPRKGNKPDKQKNSVMVGTTTELFLLLVLVYKIAVVVHQIS